MKNHKTILLVLITLLLFPACSRYIKINHGNYTSVIERGYKGVDTHFYPFERSLDTTLMGYKTVYTTEDYRVGAFVFDTIPFCNKKENPVSNMIYEVYYYKGQPRFTKEIGRFTEDGFCHQNRRIIDVKNWEKQVELGLSKKPPKLTIEHPILPNKLELDTTNYTTSDIDYILKGRILRNRVSYGINDYDSSYIYFRRDGFTHLSASPSRIFVKRPDKSKSMFSFWISDFPKDLSTLNVYPNEDVTAMFDLISDSVLNSKSCEISFDSAAYKKTKYAPAEYGAEYIDIKFKDGSSKTWLYHRYEDEKISTLNKYPWMQKFMDDIRFLNNIHSNRKEYIDPDFTLGDACDQRSIKLQ